MDSIHFRSWLHDLSGCPFSKYCFSSRFCRIHSEMSYFELILIIFEYFTASIVVPKCARSRLRYLESLCVQVKDCGGSAQMVISESPPTKCSASAGRTGDKPMTLCSLMCSPTHREWIKIGFLSCKLTYVRRIHRF